MPCKKHEDQLDGRSDPDCKECDLADWAEENYWDAYWREHYEAEDRRLDPSAQPTRVPSR
jgi:hypothetical protein